MGFVVFFFSLYILRSDLIFRFSLLLGLSGFESNEQLIVCFVTDENVGNRFNIVISGMRKRFTQKGSFYDYIYKGCPVGLYIIF